MTRIGKVLREMATKALESRRYVFVDCKSKKTGNEWKHLVDAEHADSIARSIERRWPGDVKVTVRR